MKLEFACAELEKENVKEKMFGGEFVEEKVIKAIPAVPFGLMMGAVSAVIAFIAAIVMVLFMMPYFTFARGFEWIAGLGGLWALVLPMAVFIVSFVQGLIIAVVYNFLAPRIGGIRLNLA